MTPHTQRITGDPARGDGRATDGTPGDCLRTAVASLLDLPVDDVPHFAQHASWWEQLRRWARDRGGDFACVLPVDGSLRGLIEPGDLLVLASGPSPRGPFWHTVIADLDLSLVHDPHPTRAGLLAVEDALVYLAEPYDPPPHQYALLSGPFRGAATYR